MAESLPQAVLDAANVSAVSQSGRAILVRGCLLPGTHDLIVGAMADFNTSSAGITGSWGNEGENTHQPTFIGESEDQLNVTIGSYQSQFALNASESDWAANITAFKVL